MIEQLQRELAVSGPLTIKEAVFADPTLTLAGDGWSLSTPSAWRVLKGGVLEFGWSGAEASDSIWELCGLSIVSVAPQSSRMSGDPAFELSDGRWLENLLGSRCGPLVVAAALHDVRRLAVRPGPNALTLCLRPGSRSIPVRD